MDPGTQYIPAGLNFCTGLVLQKQEKEENREAGGKGKEEGKQEQEERERRRSKGWRWGRGREGGARGGHSGRAAAGWEREAVESLGSVARHHKWSDGDYFQDQLATSPRKRNRVCRTHIILSHYSFIGLHPWANLSLPPIKRERLCFPMALMKKLRPKEVKSLSQGPQLLVPNCLGSKITFLRELCISTVRSRCG